MAIGGSVYGLLTLGRLLVSLDVEVDEKTEVARQEQAAEHRSTLSSCASSQMGQRRLVSGREVGISYMNAIKSWYNGFKSRRDILPK